MSYRVICGTYHVTGYSPDGDSVRFKAADGQLWSTLAGHRARRNARDHVQLRLDAIDTLETHYGHAHQPLALAKAAMEALMAWLGITGCQWNAAGTLVSHANDGTEGFILAREVERNGRPVAFAFAGTPRDQSGDPLADGAEVTLDMPMLADSVNHRMLREGLAYPTYYKGLYAELRKYMTEAVEEARQPVPKGVWAVDVTNAGFEVAGLASIVQTHVILPKLFRRLATYLEAGGSVVGFKANLAAHPEEVVVIDSAAHGPARYTHLDTLIDEDGTTIRLTEQPENLIFMG